MHTGTREEGFGKGRFQFNKGENLVLEEDNLVSFFSNGSKTQSRIN